MHASLLLSLPGGTEIIYLVVIIVIILGILIAVRKPFLWFFGIIDLINESRKQTRLLEEIRNGLQEKK